MKKILPTNYDQQDLWGKGPIKQLLQLLSLSP